MKEFKASKPKAAIMAAANVLYDESGKVIDSLIKINPTLATTLTVIRANFGILLAYKQEKLNQFTEYLMDNQHTFTLAKMDDKDFQEGIPVFLESYFKLRSTEKLKLAENIFLDFSKSLSMPLYPLERYDDTLEKISQTGIQFLGFINSEVPKLKLEYVQEQMYEHGNDIKTKTMDEWITIYGATKPLNFFIEEHIKKQVIESMQDYKRNQPLDEESRLKEELRRPFNAAQSELEQLGLAGGGNVSVGGVEKNITLILPITALNSPRL